MFRNIGKKIKILAVVCTIIGIIASVIVGVILLSQGIMMGLAVIVGGIIVFWIGSWYTYAFGELVDNSAIIAAAVKGSGGSSKQQRLEQLNKLKADGIITEQEYQDKLKELN